MYSVLSNIQVLINTGAREAPIGSFMNVKECLYQIVISETFLSLSAVQMGTTVGHYGT
jgi:hypothetical protein